MKLAGRSFVFAIAIATLWLPGTARASTPSCADQYPEATWDVIQDDPVRIETSSIPVGLGERYLDEAGVVTDWVTDEIGPVDVTICLVDETSTFDRDRYRDGSQLFHAFSDLEAGLIAIDTRRQIKFVGPAMAYAIPQHALYQSNGREPFPEPLAGAIAYWYRARLVEHLPYHERQQRGANLFETEGRIDWTAGAQPLVLLWDPDGNDVSIGAFVDYAVAERGAAILLETDGAVWTGIESEWRTQLRIDLTGSDSPSTGWRGGALMVIVVTIVGVGMASYGIYRSRRRRPRPETPEPIPGFFGGHRSKNAG